MLITAFRMQSFFALIKQLQTINDNFIPSLGFGQKNRRTNCPIAGF